MGRGLVVVLAIATLATLIVAATGGAALQTKSASVEIESAESGSVTAKCKRGREALSGGFETESNAQVFGSTRAGKRKWTVAGRAGGGGATLTALTYCDKSEPGLKQKSTDVAYDSDAVQVSATARCKRRSEAVSGGFSSQSEGPPPVTALWREGKRKWTASGLVFALNPGTFTAFAYCDKSEPGLKTKSSTVSLGNFENGSATAKCKRGSEAVSGGFSSPEVTAAGFPGPAVIVHESQREGKRKWTASGRAGAGGGSLTVYAYCEKK
jgi:hypothetical protein